MKTKSLIITWVVSAGSFAFMSCSGDKKESAAGQETHDSHRTEESASDPAVTEISEPQFEVTAEFQTQLAAVFDSYVQLQEAFVSSDANNVQQKASATTDALSKVDMTQLTEAAHNDWMSYQPAMKNALQEIQSSENIEAQRKSFSTLSENLYKSVKAFGMGDQQAYYTYCPMAFNDEGAYWLSNTEKIRNPYFGDKMLNCGQVKEKLM